MEEKKEGMEDWYGDFGLERRVDKWLVELGKFVGVGWESLVS